MLRHRLIAGSLLAAAMGAVLVGDTFLAPAYPCLLAGVTLAGVAAAYELLDLLPAGDRPRAGFVLPAVLLVLAANWHPHVTDDIPVPGPWQAVLFLFVGVVVAAFLVEMWRYTGGGRCVPRIANGVLLVAYVALLPSFLIQLRWLPEHSGLALTLTIFVPKVGDIGAYFTGRLLGRHRFAPLLSPKKTWEGFAGGLAASALMAVGLSFAAPVFRHGVPEAVGFGLAVGLAGVFGDLAESLLKRDAAVKDAAKSIPGFGGVLDVIDSVLFAGPVAYWWFTLGN